MRLQIGSLGLQNVIPDLSESHVLIYAKQGNDHEEKYKIHRMATCKRKETITIRDYN